MGLFSCPLPCYSFKESQSHHPEASTSLSSQPSLPSVPSLNPRLSQQPTITHHCISTLKGHSSSVFSLALSEKFLYSGSSGKEIRIWSRDPSSSSPTYDNSTNGKIVAVGSGAVKSLVVWKDKLFSAHQDHKIRVWKINNQSPHIEYKCMTTLPTLTDRVLRLLSAKNYVQVRRHKQFTWVHHVDTVSALALSKDGSHLYSASWDRTFKIWRTSDFRCVQSVWKAHDDAINAIVLSNDECIYTGSADKKIKVWKKENQYSLVATLEKHNSAVNALALSDEGSVLYSGACDRSIIAWEKDGGAGGHMVVAGALRGHTKAILCLAVVSDLVCSGSADKTVRIWSRGVDSRSYSCLAVFEGHKGPVKCLTAAASSGTSYLVYSGSLDCDIMVWQICLPLT